MKTKRGLTMALLMVFITYIPTLGSHVESAGMMVLEKMKMIPAAIALRMTDVSITASAGDASNHAPDPDV